MAATKHILVLANSMKHSPGRCVAGREIHASGSQYTIGSWVRPVSSHGEGELSRSETRLQQGRQPCVFDFVEIPLNGPSSDALQPENWDIARSPRWRQVNSLYDKPMMDLLVEQPSSLWLQRNQRCDRVSSRHLQSNVPAQTLYLIGVKDLRVQLEWREWDGQYSRRRRALFRYNEVDYDMSITDPVFIEKYRSHYPARNHPANIIEVPSPDGCYLCVSLAPEFNGYHYKVVATVLIS